jgi:hypothetical protein
MINFEGRFLLKNLEWGIFMQVQQSNKKVCLACVRLRDLFRTWFTTRTRKLKVEGLFDKDHCVVILVT